jgi:hypothetical protein
MKKHEILSPHSRAALFDPPTDPTAIVRHYTVSPQDLTLILRRRRDPNRLGFAVHLAYLRFPGRVLGAQEDPPSDMLVFIASQIDVAPGFSPAMRGAMKPRRAHLGEIQTYLGVRSFQRGDYRGIARVAIEAATGTDRGDIIVSAMIEHLRHRGVLLPASATLERIALAARALVPKRAHKSLVGCQATDKTGPLAADLNFAS